ncbi:hypothetical protein ACOSQ2_029986 [Xanthoceras sorbifolium]
MFIDSIIQSTYSNDTEFAQKLLKHRISSWVTSIAQRSKPTLFSQSLCNWHPFTSVVLYKNIIRLLSFSLVIRKRVKTRSFASEYMFQGSSFMQKWHKKIT